MLRYTSTSAYPFPSHPIISTSIDDEHYLPRPKAEDWKYATPAARVSAAELNLRRGGGPFLGVLGNSGGLPRAGLFLLGFETNGWSAMNVFLNGIPGTCFKHLHRS